MPFKTRRKHYAKGGVRVGTSGSYTDISTDGTLTMEGTARVSKDVYIGAWQFGGAGSPMGGGTAASLTTQDCLGGSWPCLRFGHDGSACGVFGIVGAPLDADTGASATIWVDWASGSAGASADNVAVWGACVYYLSTASVPTEWTFAGSGAMAASIFDTSGCVFGSASVCQFNAINGSPIGLRLWHDSTSGSDVSGSNTCLLGARIRYTADKLGT